MQTPFFIYSKQLSNQQITQFLQASAHSFTLLGTTTFIDYTIAFFQREMHTTWEELKVLAAQIRCDIAELRELPELHTPGILVMDMDSTAIQIECIDELAKLAGVGTEVSRITSLAMQGELDFEQSLRRRVQALSGAPERILQKVRENLPLTEGLVTMVSTLQQYGWKIAIASGGFDYFANELKARFALTEAVANRLEVVDGKITGKVLGNIVDAQYKTKVLTELAQTYCISPQQWVAIGDGANDLPMLNTATLGIAFYAKPKVQQQAKVVINFGDLTALLVLLNAQSLFNSLH